MYQISLFPWGKGSCEGFPWELCNLAEFAAGWALGRAMPTLPHQKDPPVSLMAPCLSARGVHVGLSALLDIKQQWKTSGSFRF